MNSIKGSIAVPSSMHTYSVCTEFIQKWFFSKFKNNYFKSIHIEDKHIFDNFRNFNFSSILKPDKPSIAIVPRLNFEYNRDYLDTNMFGLDHLISNPDPTAWVFRSPEKKSLLTLRMRQEEIRYTFKMRLETRGQQVDLYRYINLALRVGHNDVQQVNVDYHIPYGIMLQIAKDQGFNVQNDKIQDVNSFLRDFNAKSRFPATYKFRNINGKMEFFFRAPVEILIYLQDAPSAGDGERDGQLSTNFDIDLEVLVKYPSVMYYLYHSISEHEYVSSTTPHGDTQLHILTIEVPEIPLKNSAGWGQYLTTQYVETDLTKPLSIEFKDLFDSIDCQKVIDANNAINVDSSIFIDFKLYNGNDIIPYTIDWKTMTMSTTVLPTNITSHIVIYMDTNYLYEKLDSVQEYEKSRLK